MCVITLSFFSTMKLACKKYFGKKLTYRLKFNTNWICNISQKSDQFFMNMSVKSSLWRKKLARLLPNADQTPSKYDCHNWCHDGSKRRKNISRTYFNDKRSIRLILCKSHNGTILPYKLIYKGKTARSLLNIGFPDSFSVLHLCTKESNEKYWDNETETICLINDVLFSYIKKVTEEKLLARD